MQYKTPVSGEAENYLSCYHKILEDMIEGMTSAVPSESISQTFIRQMLPHRRAAVRMCENILRYTRRAHLQALAENMLSEQTKSALAMQELSSRCGAWANTAEEMRCYLHGFYDIAYTMFAQMEAAPADSQTDYDFLREMLPHCRASVQMAKNALLYPLCPELASVLNTEIPVLEGEVRELERLSTLTA